MYPCRWLEVFVLASCVVWAAGQEDLIQPSAATIQRRVIKLVSAELRPNAEGNLETRCTVSTIPEVPLQPQSPSNPEQRPLANTTLPDPSPTPSKTCPPTKTATQIYDSGSLFGAATNVSFIPEEAKNYFVAHSRERSFSKAQVLEIILSAMMAEHERVAAGIKVLKSEILSAGVEEGAPRIVVLCLPDGFKVERVLDDCVGSERDVVGSRTTQAQVMSSTTSVEKGDFQQEDKPEIKTVVDLLKGSTTSPDYKVTPRYLPSQQPATVTIPNISLPTAAEPPTTQLHPVTKTTPKPPDTRRTAATLELSVSGIIRAVFPLSISKVTAQLSLSFAPVAETNILMFPTGKPNTKSPSFLKPSLRLSPSGSISPRTAESLTSATPPTTADSILLQPSSRRPGTVASGSTTAAVASTASTATTTTFIPSSPPLMEATPHPSDSSSPAISPTASQFSTQPTAISATSEAFNTGELS